MGCLFNDVGSAGCYCARGKGKNLQRAGVRIFANQRVFQQRLDQQRLFALWGLGWRWSWGRNTNFDNWRKYDNRCVNNDNNGNGVAGSNRIANGDCNRERKRECFANDNRLTKRKRFSEPRGYGAGHGGDRQPDEQSNSRRIDDARRIAQQ
jgi:hypothetical protein